MNTNKGPIQGRIEALRSALSQTVETVTRNSRIFIESSDVDDINPPEDIDEYHEYYKSEGIISGNIDQFVRDVVAPGVRIEADNDETEAYFTGETEDATLPENAPEGGFLEQCGVTGGERRQPFYPYLKTSIVQKYTRGTVLHEYLKSEDDREDPEFTIQGFKHIRPETVSARTHANKNILVSPEETEIADELTPRDEAAAYVQYDDNSILGSRVNGFDKDEIALSQNDVLKQVNRPDIGGDDGLEDGVWGISAVGTAGDDIEDYRQMKRDLAESIKRTAYPVWIAEFTPSTYDLGEEVLVQRWKNDKQDEWIDDVDSLEAGGIVGHDGSVDLGQWGPDVPDLEYPLQHLVDDILAALPAPKYATAHGEQITQHVTGEQSESYRDLIEEERRAQERDWTQAFREVAERHPDLDPAGIELKIQPEESSNPIAELDDEQIQKMEQFMSALNDGLGKVPIDSVLDVEAFLTTTMDLPEDVFTGDERDLDESDPQVQDMAEEMGLPMDDSADAEADD